MKIAWLVAEYNGHDIYMGWHLYLRDTRRHQRNKDGEWGWIRQPQTSSAAKLLAELGCPITGDGTASDDGIRKFAKLFPIPGKPIWGENRGGIKVMLVGDFGEMKVAI